MRPQTADSTHRPRLTRTLATVLACAAVAAPAAGANSGGTQVHATCAGDLVTGTVRVGRATPAGELELTLLARHTSKSAFARTGKSAWIDAYGGRTYPFSFDIGQLSASAYRVDPPGASSNVVPAASCAPGHQVPEAPMSLLLPLSVLGVVGLVLARRRRLDPLS